MPVGPRAALTCRAGLRSCRCSRAPPAASGVQHPLLHPCSDRAFKEALSLVRQERRLAAAERGQFDTGGAPWAGRPGLGRA